MKKLILITSLFAVIFTLNSCHKNEASKADITIYDVSWNHGISEVLNSLIKNGLEIKSFDEFDYSPYNCFNKTVEFEPNKYRIEHLDNKIPLVYSIKSIRNDNR
jgi:hypothetical protein